VREFRALGRRAVSLRPASAAGQRRRDVCRDSQALQPPRHRRQQRASGVLKPAMDMSSSIGAGAWKPTPSRSTSGAACAAAHEDGGASSRCRARSVRAMPNYAFIGASKAARIVVRSSPGAGRAASRQCRQRRRRRDGCLSYFRREETARIVQGQNTAGRYSPEMCRGVYCFAAEAHDQRPYAFRRRRFAISADTMKACRHRLGLAEKSR